MPRVLVEGGEQLVAKLDAMGLGAERLLEAATRAGAEVFMQEANKRAPGPHIKLSNPQHKGLTVAYQIGPDKQHFYYIFFERGAVPHGITAKKGDRLAFQIETGDLKVVSGVKHPGMAARPFLRPGYDAGKARAIEAFINVIKRTLKV